MSSTWLTKRRAVDHCRVRSSLCRMSWPDVSGRARGCPEARLRARAL